LVVTVFGNFERDEVLEDIERLFGSMKPGEPALPLYDERAPSRQVETLHMDKEQAMVMIGFRGPNIYHDDRYPTEVMTSILGSSLSGRL
jgi:zinc protease